MFKDKDEELRRLEEALMEAEKDAALLQEDTAYTDAPSEEEYEALSHYEDDYRIYNTDETDVDLEEFSQEVWQPKRRVSGLAALACILMTAIILVVLYLVLRYGGWL